MPVLRLKIKLLIDVSCEGTVPTLVVPLAKTLAPDDDHRYKAVTDTKVTSTRLPSYLAPLRLSLNPSSPFWNSSTSHVPPLHARIQSPQRQLLHWLLPPSGSQPPQRRLLSCCTRSPQIHESLNITTIFRNRHLRVLHRRSSWTSKVDAMR